MLIRGCVVSVPMDTFVFCLESREIEIVVRMLNRVRLFCSLVEILDMT
jgi:hypothetical protein